MLRMIYSVGRVSCVGSDLYCTDPAQRLTTDDISVDDISGLSINMIYMICL